MAPWAKGQLGRTGPRGCERRRVGVAGVVGAAALERVAHLAGGQTAVSPIIAHQFSPSHHGIS